MALRNVAGWNVPAPTSMSRGWRMVQPCLAQNSCRARMRSWKVSGFVLAGKALVGMFAFLFFNSWARILLYLFWDGKVVEY